jgi:hypothetical protein
MPATRVKNLVMYLVQLRLGFLETDDIRLLPGHPLKKSLPGSRTDAVHVDRNNAHGSHRLDPACMIATPTSDNDL